jgi:D-glycero-alpha-D-manno-heptose 1-phosphate guanylyltransferase
MNTKHPTEMLILAGGLGTRLRSVVSDVPKPMASIAGRPFLAYLLDYWISQGVQRFVLSTGYLGDIVRGYFGEAYRNARIDYVHESSPLGTGGALQLALNAVAWTGEMALMANGDTWFPVNLQQFCNDARQQNLPIVLALKAIEKNDRYGSVELDGSGKVKAFGIKSDGLIHINAGCYLFDVEILKQALAGRPESFSLENDFLNQYAANGMVASSVQDQPFLDIGIPDDFRKASFVLNKTA